MSGLAEALIESFFDFDDDEISSFEALRAKILVSSSLDISKIHGVSWEKLAATHGDDAVAVALEWLSWYIVGKLRRPSANTIRVMQALNQSGPVVAYRGLGEYSGSSVFASHEPTSWTLSKKVAKGFAKYNGGSGGAVLQASFSPKDQIINLSSVPSLYKQLGSATSAEKEVIVKAGSYQIRQLM